MGVSFFGHLFPKRSLVRIDQLEERARLRAHFGGPPIGGRRFPVFRLQGTQLDEAKELREVPAALPLLGPGRTALRQPRTRKSPLGRNHFSPSNSMLGVVSYAQKIQGRFNP